MTARKDAPSCPLPHPATDSVQLGHGSGGRLSEALLREVFLPAFNNPHLAKLNDQAAVPLPGGRLAFTTDSFVVDPLFFPGGDIGSLAVYGTVNDLAVGGARPLYLSAAFILEEGLPMADLKAIAQSMQAACLASGVALVTGDTKVVGRGKGDGVFITTSGVGALPGECTLSCERAKPGDRVLLSGPIGDHGIAILSVREGIAFETPLESDSAPLVQPIARVLVASPGARCLRDPTRGGVASALNEIARASGVGIELDEARIPIRDAVAGACELFGLDPLYVACEGRFLAVVPEEEAEAALAALKSDPLGHSAALVGEVVSGDPGRVVLRSRIGGRRVVQMLAGEQLPRIC